MSPLLLAIAAVLLAAVILWQAQPPWAFYLGNPRPFGFEPPATLLPPWLLLLTVGLVVYYIVCMW